MSGFGGFGGFGQSNNQQQSTGFGGFGSSNTNTNTGFGSTNTNTGFGASNNTSGGGLFGGGSTGFGGSGGFGSTTNNAFGAPKPTGFGAPASTGGSLFGNNTATASSSGFGGFGSTTTPSTGFGATNTNAGGGLFGSAATTSGFGSTNTTSAFGAPASTALSQGVGESPGTGNVPFQAFVEKEPNSTSNQQNSFQNICFQQPYQKWSPEELRLTDYNQGRRYGNASNQAGAFGATNFGGFGSSNTASTGGFGATNTNTGSSLFGGAASSSPFGGAQPASTGFGAANTTGGGLFGAAKPAGGLFGSTTPAQPSGGGLFGSSTNTGFGSTTTGGFGQTANTGSSLFGNTAATSKPAFSFGSTAPAATGTGFGAGAATNTTSAFGGGGGLFGNTQQQQNTTTGFGTAQPAANTNPFGGFGNTTQQQQQTGTSSLFGGGAKPAGGLFGQPAAAPGTSLFGNTAQSTTNASPFGGGATNTGGLFGNKPATGTGSSLFGGGNTQTNTGGSSLFGGFGNQNQNQGQQQQNTSSLFGSLNTNANSGGAKPGLFGSTTQQSGGSSLFGGGNQQQGTGLFGSLNNNQQQQQQQPQNSFGSSMFNTSQQNQQIPQALTASITDSAAFGSASLFSNLANNTVQNPGPIATPLSSSTRSSKAPALPMYKLNSASASRFSTPQKRGFGFSYSSYSTPNSISSASSTPGAFGGSLLGASTFGRTLNKSMSTSSLRRSFNTEDSILAPGAFTASPSARQFGSSGSMKKLTVNRGLRADLFSAPTTKDQPSSNVPTGGILKKRVSFDANVNGNTAGSSSPLKQVNSASPSSAELGFIRPPPSVNGKKSNGNNPPPEMEQVSNSNMQLAIVREEEVSAPEQPAPKPKSRKDPEAGEYWMSPSKEEIEAMNREQRKKVSGFTVGRKDIGKIQFNVPVDLSNINLDDIPGPIVNLMHRSATVYPIEAKKPPMGKGLNVPATISLENSWPRNKSAKAGMDQATLLKKHINSLKKVMDTKFISYDDVNGIWTFTVEHFTTYAFDSDDDEDQTENEFGQSTLSVPPDTPTPKTRSPRSENLDQSFASASEVTQTESDPEDTFQFRKKKVLPGAFDERELELYEDEDMEEEHEHHDQESFLDERSVGSQSDNGVEEPMEQDDVYQDDESVSIMDQEMAGSYPEAGNTAEQDGDSLDGDEDMDVVVTPGAILRARMRALKNTGTPSKQPFTAVDDWAAALQQTVSPKKQDRALLKTLIDIQGDEPRQDGEPTPKPRRVVSDGRGFATSIDLMNSLFGQARSPVKQAKVPAKTKGFEWPYAKRPKSSDNDTANMDPQDRLWHESMKPSWSYDGTLVYPAPGNMKPFGRSSRRPYEKIGLLSIQKGSIVSEHRDVHFAKFSNEASADLLKKHKELAVINGSSDVPYATLPEKFSFSDFFDDTNGRDHAATHEKLVWQLASVLWDHIAVPEELREIPDIEIRLRKDNFSAFWQKLVDDAATRHIAMARSHEEKAIAALAGHRISEACSHLINGGNFRLATLVALIGSKDSMKKDIREQLNDWQKCHMLSEFTQPIRALWELLAGNVCVADGVKAAPEDRVESFVISKRFGLDWRQAFGLRLWYGNLSSETHEDAVTSFAEDLSQERETSTPVPWYVEHRVPTLWDDNGIRDRQDLLWGLLKLDTFQNVDLDDVLRPENSQLSPMDTRLSWQLSQAIIANGAVTYADDDHDKADRTTLSFASQLTNEGSWLDATFVLLHVHSDEARAKTIQSHLGHHAGKIGAEDSPSFTYLHKTLKIPAAWIWEAKALYARSVDKNPRAEVECLIKAGAFVEAHRTFSKEVAPKAIVELDYDTLRALLHGFEGKEDKIPDWYLGGEIYQDFLQLVDGERKGWPVDDLMLERLLASLPAVVEGSRHPGFMETVAVETMGEAVARAVVAVGKKGEKANLPKLLRLPLTEDKYLKHTVELSLEYYRGVMAGGAR